MENQTTPGWNNRLQALLSGDRERIENAAVFNERAVESFVPLDLISSLELGGGTLELGIQNLLDTDYFPVISQQQTNELSNAAAQGRTVTLGYNYRW
ncbi:MAG: hypothetical protein AAGD25_35220 [Cyanobacteria bacterium P01_F01_bin.150]